MKAFAFPLALIATLCIGLPAQAQTRKATATIVGCTAPTITGSARLKEFRSAEGVKEVDVDIAVNGLPDGVHAVHIHKVGSCATAAKPCDAGGGHFDPSPNGNSSPDGNHPFHLGDLVNMKVKNGHGELHVTTTRVSVSPDPLSVLDADGSAFIIHVNPDTYCPNGPSPACAGGARAACGIIQP